MSSRETGNRICYIFKKIRDKTQDKFPEEWYFYPETHLVHIQIKHGEGDVVTYENQTDTRNVQRAMRWFLRNAGVSHYIIDIDKLSKLLAQYREELKEEKLQTAMANKNKRSLNT